MSTMPLDPQPFFANETEVLLREMPSVRDPSIKCVVVQHKVSKVCSQKNAECTSTFCSTRCLRWVVLSCVQLVHVQRGFGEVIFWLLLKLSLFRIDLGLIFPGRVNLQLYSLTRTCLFLDSRFTSLALAFGKNSICIPITLRLLAFLGNLILSVLALDCWKRVRFA